MHFYAEFELELRGVKNVGWLDTIILYRNSCFTNKHET